MKVSLVDMTLVGGGGTVRWRVLITGNSMHEYTFEELKNLRLAQENSSFANLVLLLLFSKAEWRISTQHPTLL